MVFQLPKITSVDIHEKRVLVRMDLDVPLEEDENGQRHVKDDSRIQAALPTLRYLIDNGASKIYLAGHIGRVVQGRAISTIVLRDLFADLLNEDVSLRLSVKENLIENVNFEDEHEHRIVLLENLRMWTGEEANDEEFARELASLGDIYVNEAFAVSHRAHASIVEIPKLLPHAAGMRFEKELEMLSKVTTNPERPLVILISGVKEDKLGMVEDIKHLVDKVLVGGRLPEYIGDKDMGEKVLVAKLNPDKEDITLNSIEQFEEEIRKAKTVVLAGVVGKVEDEGHQLGTKRVFEAVANANAYKVAGGGDTEAALTKFGLTEKFTWISVGGGAMLDFLAKGTLPGIEALLH